MSGPFFVPHDILEPLRGAEVGPLSGLTAVVKDMYDIAGTRTGGGSPEWLAEKEPAAGHAAAVSRILEAGATVVGKTICEELFYSIMGINAHYGIPTNIRAPGRVPGGSSSGSAAACGAGVADFALGSDTAGSIRIPASFNGLYGLRPTHGRIDLSGAMAMAPTFDTAGWFAATPGVFRRVGSVLLDKSDRTQSADRLIVASDLFEQADGDVAELAQTFLALAAPSLPQAKEQSIAPDHFLEWCDAFRIVQAREVWQTFGDFVTRARPNLGPGIKERMEFAATVTAEQSNKSRAIVDSARAEIRKMIPPGTLVAMPTAPSAAPKADLGGEAMEAFRSRVMRLTAIAGLAGLPQLTIPAGNVPGGPAGLSLVGWTGADETLLDLAVSLSRHCGILID